jgi:cation transport ATPase
VITLSRAIRKTIRANLFWVCFFHLLGLILATGLLYPAIGVQMRPSGVVLFTILGLVFAGVNTWHLRGVVLEA